MQISLIQKRFLIFFFSVCFSNSHALEHRHQSNLNYPSCEKGSALQLKRSNELQKLLTADQKDREHWQNMSEKKMMKLAYNDLVRRKRVGEIFGEGCFQDAKDYMAAALIYQHGDMPDHYFQAYIWSKRAVELGDLNGQQFSSLAIDRYLISIGKKQLFGTQYMKSPASDCYCMQPIEKSFPDKFRKEYSSRSLDDNYKILASINNKNCPKTECNNALQPAPKGSIIGLW